MFGKKKIKTVVDAKAGELIRSDEPIASTVNNFNHPYHKPHLKMKDDMFSAVIREDKIDGAAVSNPGEAPTSSSDGKCGYRNRWQSLH